MAEYTIVGIEPVIKILKLLQPYVYLKKKHIEVALKIYRLLGSKKFNLVKFIQASSLVDQFGTLNYSRKRTNTSKELKKFLGRHNLYPRNDWYPIKYRIEIESQNSIRRQPLLVVIKREKV